MFVAAAVCVGAVVSSSILTMGKFGSRSEPTLEQIRHIEVELTRPREALPLDSYVRYYSSKTVAGETIVLGRFVYKGGQGRIVQVRHDQMPQIMDGGCNVIEMRYSSTTRRVLSIFCHGVA